MNDSRREQGYVPCSSYTGLEKVERDKRDYRTRRDRDRKKHALNALDAVPGLNAPGIDFGGVHLEFEDERRGFKCS